MRALEVPTYPTDDDETVDPSHRCIKCGRVDDNPRWHPTAEKYWSEQGRNEHCEKERYRARTASVAEHLHLYCRCGYEWSIPVLAEAQSTVQPT